MKFIFYQTSQVHAPLEKNAAKKWQSHSKGLGILTPISSDSFCGKILLAVLKRRHDFLFIFPKTLLAVGWSIILLSMP